MTWQVIEADCVEQMKLMDEASVDAVVTDPPAGISFMGRGWDSDRSGGFVAWLASVMEEALRVTKPGGHALVWALPRTSHWTGSAIEAAGWEIRDRITHHFGSGFPKSLDVSKAIDRTDDTRRPEREALGQWLREQREAAGLQQKEVAAHWPSVTGGLTGCVANWEGGFNCPTLDQWADLKRIIGLPDDMDAEVWRLNGRKGQPGENWEKREVVGYDESVNVYDGRHAFGDSMRGQEYSKSPITAPATPEAQRWQGWGTALKPATEDWWLARKPLVGTVAQNVERFGTGALAIDRCRIGVSEADDIHAKNPHTEGGFGHAEAGIYGDSDGAPAYDPAQGRWPANVALSCDCPDDSHSEPTCAVAELDRQSGETQSTARPRNNAGGFGENFMDDNWEPPNGYQTQGHGDTGGASRFFYCAKSSRRERNAGLEGFEERPSTERFRGERESSFSDPRMDREQERRPAANSHPTVKPVDLMRWLVRLVTPPDGLVLDPFAGSGTTGIACVLEDFDFIGIEREPEYVEIAKARIDYWAKQPKQLGLLDAA